MNGRPAESETLFERAVQLATAEHNREFLGWAQFNARAAEALEAAIAIDPSHKAQRERTDHSGRRAPFPPSSVY
jgi:hypothetical protein